MKIKDTTLTTFYQLLGRVFYAAVQSDKVIRPEEISELKRIVKDVWLPVESSTDEFNSDAAFQIEIVFDYLRMHDVVVEDVIKELKTYKTIHSAMFTDQMIGLILETTSRIISSYVKQNKSELVFYHQLKFVLKN